jgi:uncharacterized protein (DUF1015 family)
MARFEAFRATTYDPGLVRADDVIAPPYDVVGPVERATLAARSPYNAIHVELPVAEAGADPYTHAGRLFAAWHEEKVVRLAAEPSLHVYRMTFPTEDGTVRSTTGVLGALAIDPTEVLPHEETTPKEKRDRLSLLRAARTNFSPIWGLSTAQGLGAVLEGAVGQGEPFAGRDADGVLHESWPVTSTDAIERIVALVRSTPVLIADGHHRYETASTFHEEQPELAAASSILAFVVELAEDQLAVQAIHRLLRGVNPETLPSQLEQWFEVEPAMTPDALELYELMGRRGALGLITQAGSWLLRPKEDPGGEVDSVLLAKAVSGMGVQDVVYQHGLALTKASVDEGRAEAAVLLRPVPVSRIARTARGDKRMAPKSTFFYPKPRTGMVFRELDPKPS